jgi:DNA adenine methylase
MAVSATPRPFLKWAGGKTQLTDALMARMPPAFGTYHEPFLGSGAFFFCLYREGKLQRAILSDINPELIDTYLAIRDQPAAVIQLLAEFPYDKTFYYQLRARDPWGMSLAERAARMIYLNKTGYNGLYRVNRQGRFNVPFGRHKSPRYFDPENLLAVSRALQRAEITCAPFESVLTRAQAGDWVYFDPPYMPISETAHFTAYHADGFGLADQARLRDVCLRLTEIGVGVMVSNSDVPDIRDLYTRPCFRIDTVFANRAINSKGARRGKIAELVIVNYDCAGHSFEVRPRHMPDQHKAKTGANKPAQQTREALPHGAQSRAGCA